MAEFSGDKPPLLPPAQELIKRSEREKAPGERSQGVKGSKHVTQRTREHPRGEERIGRAQALPKGFSDTDIIELEERIEDGQVKIGIKRSGYERTAQKINKLQDSGRAQAILEHFRSHWFKIYLFFIACWIISWKGFFIVVGFMIIIMLCLNILFTKLESIERFFYGRTKES